VQGLSRCGKFQSPGHISGKSPGCGDAVRAEDSVLAMECCVNTASAIESEGRDRVATKAGFVGFPVAPYKNLLCGI
jgi:hypothetical protein